MRGFRYLSVTGGSMAPTLREGDWILAVRGAGVRVGDVVVLEPPGRPGLLVVKRVARVGPLGVWVLGDAPEASTDSRHFGWVREVDARVLWRARPWGPLPPAPGRGGGARARR